MRPLQSRAPLHLRHDRERIPPNPPNLPNLASRWEGRRLIRDHACYSYIPFYAN